MQTTTIPGTTLPLSEHAGMFDRFRPLIQATAGLTLGQVCQITGLEPSTIQNWIKRGFVARPYQKKYFERQLARILLISTLRESMKIEQVGMLMALVNGSTEDESDDLISEDRLYDYLCAVIERMEGRALSSDAIAMLVQIVTADFTFDGEKRKRLCDALTIMSLAYIAGVYKQEAEDRFRMMKGE